MEELLQTLVVGFAVGSRIALVAIGFSLVYRTSEVLNFAQGAWLLVGAYLVHHGVQVGLPFWTALVLAGAACAALAALSYRITVKPMRNQPVFAVILVTVGLLTIARFVIAAAWGTEPRNLGDPFGLSTVTLGGVTVPVRDLFTIGATVASVAVIMLLLRGTAFGLAMRATADDREAALVQGVRTDRVVALSWALAAAFAALAGVAASAGVSRLAPGVVETSFVALAAVVIGGLDSPGGGVVAALLLGVSQQFVAVYQPEYVEVLGRNFASIFPYVLLVIVLLVRPYGLAGRAEWWRA